MEEVNSYLAHHLHLAQGSSFHQGHSYHTHVSPQPAGRFNLVQGTRIERPVADFIVDQGRARPAPSINVPFARNPQYIPRGDIIEQITEKLTTLVPHLSNRAALVGLGGIG